MALKTTPAKHEKTITVGIDPSIRNTGVAICIDGKVKHLYKFHQTSTGYTVSKNLKPFKKIKFKNKKEAKSPVARGYIIALELAEIMVQFTGRVKIIIEAASFKNKKSMTVNISEFAGALKVKLFEFLEGDLSRLVEVPPSTLKKSAVGNGRASKDDLIYLLKKLHGIDVAGDDDLSDACWLGLLF